MNIFQLILSKIKEGTLLASIAKTLRYRRDDFMKQIKHNNFFYFLNHERVLTKKIIEQFPVINKHHYQIGNYYLDDRFKLDKNSIVYSLGILSDIRFDEAISKKHDCPVFMYDPSPTSITFMKKNEKNPLYHFYPYAIWIEDMTRKFYYSTTGSSPSTIFFDDKSQYFTAQCRTLSFILNENKHQEIDVLKMDIEGAALPILEKMVDDKIFPKQIITEFERPRNDIFGNVDFFNRIITLSKKLEAEGYTSYIIPRNDAKYYSIEFIFSRLNPQ
ncbi:MAG: FkbM family methyltransferase [Maribacter sp.]|jgi:FkbM family methyltransferase